MVHNKFIGFIRINYDCENIIDMSQCNWWDCLGTYDYLLSSIPKAGYLHCNQNQCRLKSNSTAI